MAAPGTTYTIQGVKVEFPCKPYPSQMSMMYKIICGLEKKQNCLLESPTGSGKSLALLCAALAWQKAARERQKAEEKEYVAEPDCCCKCKTSSKYFEDKPQPAIPDCSTSTSEAQNDCVVLDDDDDDFKPSSLQGKAPKSARPHVSPAYEETAQVAPLDGGGTDCSPCCNCQQQATSRKKVKIPKIYFGTRTHKQIAQIAKELGRTSYKHVNMCILGSREHTCVDPQVSKGPHKNEECKLKLDGPGCRFFDNVRKISHRGLKNLGLYEAWDLEEFVDFCKKKRACPYFSSRQLKEGADIIFCPYNYLIDPVVRSSMEINLKDEIVILDEAHNIEDTAREAGSFNVSKLQLEDSLQDLRILVRDNVNPIEHGTLMDLLLGMMETIERNEKQVDGRSYDSAAKVLQGLDIVAQLTASKVGPENYQRFRSGFSKIMSDEAEKRNYEDVRKMKGASMQVIDGLLTVLDFLFRKDMMYINDYRVALIRTLSTVRTVPTGGWLNKRSVKERKEWTYTLNFWCMNPAVAFSDVSSVVRSIVLTSGTLSPMDSFASELGVPFEIQLEAAHVVGKSQVWVGTISKGPRGGMLLGSYQHSETYAYQDELGQLLLHVCESVPHGVLCFLSSYKMMEKLSNRWKDTGLWRNLETLKIVMTEPKASDKADFDLLLKRFYDAIRQSENPDKENEDEETTVTGALFLAVCRGKVSEGLDFADNNARAVVAVGIPFPNVKDTQVNLKKEYNNQHCAKKGLLSGNEWYEIQAYRALNQALGRCIRHRQDWGALILVDERYSKNPKRYTKGLSKWVRQRIQYYGFFNDAHSSLKEYTQRMLENPPADQSNISMFDVTLDESVVDRTPLLQRPDFCNIPGGSNAEVPNHQTSMHEFLLPQPATPIPGRNEMSLLINTAPASANTVTAPVAPTLLKILLSPPSAAAKLSAKVIENKTLLVPINNAGGAPMFVPVQLNGADASSSFAPSHTMTKSPPAPANDNAKLLIMPDGKKILHMPSFLPMAHTKNAVTPQGASLSTIPSPFTNNYHTSPSPLFNSQAGGFLSSQASTQNSQVFATQAKQDVTVLKGSLGSTQKQVHNKDIDFLDDLDLEFNPTLASTQRTPITPVTGIGKKPRDQSTRLHSVKVATHHNLNDTPHKMTSKQAAKPNITIPSSPPLFDSEEPDSGPMDISGGEIPQDNVEKSNKDDKNQSEKKNMRTLLCRKFSATDESGVVKTEPIENVKQESVDIRVSSCGRLIKPTYKSMHAQDVVKDEAEDSARTEQEDSKSNPHNHSLSRRGLSRRSRSGIDQDCQDNSVNKGKDNDVKAMVADGKNNKAEKAEEKPKDQGSRSGGKRRRQTVTPTSVGTLGRKKPKGVVYDDEEDHGKVLCATCGDAVLEAGADFHEHDVPSFLKPVTKETKCLLSDSSALTDSCVEFTVSKSGVSLNSHWCEDEECAVQFLECQSCHCWEIDVGRMIGAKVIYSTRRGGHFRSGQVWLVRESLSIS